MKRHHKIVLPCFLLSVVACSAEPVPSSASKNPDNQEAAATTPGTTTSKAALSEAIKPVDPKKARVIVSQTGLKSAAVGGSYQVPGFDMTLNGADYAEILRCNSTYELKSTDGVTPISKIAADAPNRTELLSWAFLGAKKAFSDCVLLGSHVARSAFTDIAAPGGTYYYVLNPCVDPSNSTDPTILCSNEIVVSDVVDYKSQRVAAEIEAAQNLANAESKSYAIFRELNRAAQMAQLEKESCETMAATAATNAAIFSGVISLVSIGIGGYLNTSMAGVGTAFSNFMQAAAGATSSGADTGCPKLDQQLKKLQTLRGQVQGTVQNIVDARKVLAEQNKEYAKLDVDINKYFKN